MKVSFLRRASDKGCPFWLVVTMLKSCQYCGRIHDERAECKKRDEAKARRDRFNDYTRRSRNEKVDRFRHTGNWTRMREHILHRDRRLCLCCLMELPGTQTKYETRDLSVHHIVPLAEDFERRLDETNLLTVCSYHHEACEAGAIDRETQRQLAEKSIDGTILRDAANISADTRG